MMTSEDFELRRARDAAEAAEYELARAEVLADLRSRPGLALAALPGQPHWSMLVTYDGHLLGTVRTSGGCLHDWYAHPDTGSPSHGPYLTARIAAAELYRRLTFVESAG
jgi:hypothetical protein